MEKDISHHVTQRWYDETSSWVWKWNQGLMVWPPLDLKLTFLCVYFPFYPFVRFWSKARWEMILTVTSPSTTFPSWTASLMKVNETKKEKGHICCTWLPASAFVLYASPSLLYSRRAAQTKQHDPGSDPPAPHGAATQLPRWTVCVCGLWRVCLQQQSVWLQTGLLWWLGWIQLW